MKTVFSRDNPFTLHRHGFLWERLKQLGPGRHLDYGAYDAAVLKQLIASNVITEGVGVDVNRAVIEESRAAMPGGISLEVITKGRSLPFEDGSFDTVSLLDVIEHIYDQRSVLRELHRILRPGGRIIVTVPGKHIFSFLDTGNFKARFPLCHKLYYQLRYSKQAYHKRYVDNENGLFGDIESEKRWHQHFTDGKLDVLLKDCGFTDVEFDGSGFFARPLVMLSTCLPFLANPLRRLRQWDAQSFESTHRFVVAAKP